MTPQPTLTTSSCPRCGLDILTADIDHLTGLHITSPHIAPILITPTHQATAIHAGLNLYWISHNPAGPGHIYTRIPHEQPPTTFTTLTQSRTRHGPDIGIAPQHVHGSNPPGQRIHAPRHGETHQPEIEENLRLLTEAIKKYPHYRGMLTEILDPPPF